MKFPPSYNPSLYEDKIYRLWEKSGFFNPDNLRRTTQSNASLTQNNAELKTFSIAMPPANATGELHIGHAMFLTIQDLLTRWRRMKGDVTLWLPGTDHASIATQARVEKNLLKTEGKTRHSLGRENFLKIVNDFAEKSRQTIRKQIRKMGSSCDWSRERYTLDSGLTKAVQEIFIRMYNDGLIYRGERIVNWCPRCESTLADDEVEYREKQGRLYYIIYKLKVQVKSSKLLKFKNYIVVATTRPETMFGDTAVAVNPQDKRYKHLIGQKAILPLTGRELTIIADKSIDAKFGTGAVKVTPCHDQQDFEIGQRHNLEKIKIFTNNGRLNQSVPTAYQNLERFKARRLILEDLEKLSLLEKTEIYKHNLGYCYRCDAVIEPMVSKQWFVNVNKKLKVKSEKLKVVVGNNNASLKEIALAVVKKGEIKIIPKRFEKIYFHWMDNLRDWCISRQIWFGHRVPVWRFKNVKCQMPARQAGGSNVKTKSQISKLNKKMGFYEEVVPQVFAGKTKTYRLRDHNFKIGDKVIFENSQTQEIFGSGIITQVVHTTVGCLPLNDPAHGAVYKKREELIRAFKKHYPNHQITAKTPAFIYTYQFIPVSKTTLFLARHGETDWNKADLWQSFTDIPLNQKGQKQAEMLAQKLRNGNFDLIITSPLKRAKATAKIIAGEKIPIIEDKSLTERNLGKFEGLAFEEIKKLYPKIKFYPNYNARLIPTIPNGESLKDLKNRAQKVAQNIQTKYQNKKILIVSHSVFLEMLYSVLTKREYQGCVGQFSQTGHWEKVDFLGQQTDDFSPKIWNLKIYGQDIFAALANGTKTIETRAGKPQGSEKYWGDFCAGDIIEFNLADEKTDKIIKSVALIKKIVKKIIHFKTIDNMFKVYKPDDDYPGKSIDEIKKWWSKFPPLVERIKKYGIWVIELAEFLPADTQELFKVQVQSPGPDWVQDTDTLDTWFSSGLWTFSTLGWPDTIKNLKFKIKNYNDYLKANDLERFHPTSVLETSYDILFFWVARMILLTTYALGEVPFKTVYLHGLVRDKLGRKMSKSLGNGIDPLDMIKKYGADAVRLSLIIGITPGNDTKMYEEKIAGYRNFVNKIWNIARYIITTPKTKNQKPQTRLTACPYRRVGQVKNAKYQNNNLTIKQFSNRTISLADKWILFELGELIKRVNRNLEAYQFSRAGEDIYEFIWHKLADWYIEIVKIEQLPRQQKILEYVLEKCLIMLHPFVPYVTEKIWSNVKCQMPARQAGGSNVKTTSQISNLKESLLMIQPWVHKIDFQVSEYGADDFIKIQEIITAIRNARAKHKTGAKEIMDYSFFAKQTKNKKNDLEQIIQNSEIIIEKLARVRLVLDDEANFVKSKNLKINLPFAVIHLNTDIKKSATRQSKNEKEKSRQYIQILKVRLNNPNFLTKAPKEIVSKIKENLRQAKLSVR